MSFPAQLIQLRKHRKLIKQQLADAVVIHVNQIKRYDAGTTQTTLEVLIKFTKALRISMDAWMHGCMVFESEPELGAYHPHQKTRNEEILLGNFGSEILVLFHILSVVGF